jgi:hypothetical protein
MPFHLKNVLSKCGFHINTPMGQSGNMRVKIQMVPQGSTPLGIKRRLDLGVRMG